MRRALIRCAPLLVALAACTSPSQAQQPPGTEPPVNQATPAPPTSVAPPPSPEPSANGPCPYLTNAFVQDANGQRVSKVRISADVPNPACFFYRSDGKVQLTAWVFAGDAKQAKAVVDRAAPVATANTADLPGGWTGGAQSTETGAVFAVAKAGTAVVITTNQAQTIKAKRVAEKAIETLGL